MAVAAEFAPVETSYRFVDSIPEVYEARLAVRQHAESILEMRREDEWRGQELLPVDALSTAHSVLACDPDSNSFVERRKGLSLDCQRLVGEWYRKLKPEYFAPTSHYFDEGKQEFFSHGLSVAQMTENALVPLGNDREEEARRKNEYVEDKTPQIMRSLGAVAIGRESIRTISECPETAIARYHEDQAAGKPNQGYWGYVPEIEKVMIRDIRLDTETNDRYEEQVALPGKYYQHEIFQIALGRAGVDALAMDKTDLHGSQLLVGDSLFDFVKLLDDVASEEWCTNVFMGEEVSADHLKDYEQFKREALERQESLKDLAETTAEFILDLAEDNFDPKKAPAHVEEFVKGLLLDEAKKDHVVARQMFDEKTVIGLREVAYLESIGQNDRAFERMLEVQREAPGGGFCGAGSCGLESVDTASEAGQQLKLKLNAKPGDKIVKDKERACKCGSKSVVYAYNAKKVNKYCETCGAFESKQGAGSASPAPAQSDYTLAA